MPSRKQHSGTPGRQKKSGRRPASDARAQPAADGLSHKERRKLRPVTPAREAAARRRSFEFRHDIIVVAGAVAAMALVAAAVGLVPAIEAAGGRGTAGTFVVNPQPWCPQLRRCMMVGTFHSTDGGVVRGVTYEGTLPADMGPAGVPAIDPGGSHLVYAPHGSRTWLEDLLLIAIVGGAVGLLLWVLPVGLSGARYRRDHAS